MAEDDELEDDAWLWRDVEEHQARAVKRLDADAPTRSPWLTVTASPWRRPGLTARPTSPVA